MNLFRWVNSPERALIFWWGMLGAAFFSIATGLALGDAIENFWIPLLTQL